MVMGQKNDKLCPKGGHTSGILSSMLNILSPIFIVLPLEIFLQDQREALKNYQGSDLQELVGRLPGAVLHSQVGSTVKKYLAAFKRWKTWASGHRMTVQLAIDYLLTLYL